MLSGAALWIDYHWPALGLRYDYECELHSDEIGYFAILCLGNLIKELFRHMNCSTSTKCVSQFIPIQSPLAKPGAMPRTL